MSEDGRIALVFPGQGCQFVGMGADLYDTSTEVRALYNRADDILGFALADLCFNGPAEALNDTANTQPAIYVTSIALWRMLRPRMEALLPRIAFAAGHSLGEFTALTAAGSLSFEDGLRLVRRRGEAMRDAGVTAPGGMAAIIGMDDEDVAALVRDAGGGDQGVWIANYNSPGQVVIAGRDEALKQAIDLAKERGAKRALPLRVSVACHTPLMSAASETLADALEDVTLQRPWLPVVSNAEAKSLTDPSAIKAALLRQLNSPVRWVESIQTMADQGVTAMIEIGPRAVVSGLIKRIDRSIALHAVTDAAAVETFDAPIAT